MLLCILSLVIWLDSFNCSWSIHAQFTCNPVKENIKYLIDWLIEWLYHDKHECAAYLSIFFYRTLLTGSPIKQKKKRKKEKKRQSCDKGSCSVSLQSCPLHKFWLRRRPQSQYNIKHSHQASSPRLFFFFFQLNASSDHTKQGSGTQNHILPLSYQHHSKYMQSVLQYLLYLPTYTVPGYHTFTQGLVSPWV